MDCESSTPLFCEYFCLIVLNFKFYFIFQQQQRKHDKPEEGKKAAKKKPEPKTSKQKPHSDSDANETDSEDSNNNHKKQKTSSKKRKLSSDDDDNDENSAAGSFSSSGSSSSGAKLFSNNASGKSFSEKPLNNRARRLLRRQQHESDQHSNHNNNNNNKNAADEANGGFPHAQAAEEAVNRARNLSGLHVSGSDIPAPLSSFSDLSHAHIINSISKITNASVNFPKYLLANVAAANYADPTPVQKQAIPVMLAKRDLLAGAPTGTGKTAAFVLPILAQLNRPQKGKFRALVLTPTRELAKQTEREFIKLGKGKKWRIAVLTKAAVASHSISADDSSSGKHDILIATPLRLVQLINAGQAALDCVEILVIDEADRLFEDGFVEQVDEILNACTFPSIQRCLFSATIPPSIESLANTILRDPVKMIVGAKNAASVNVNQKLLFVGNEEGKLLAVRQVLQQGFRPPCMIFVQSIDRAKELFHELVFDGVNVDVIHADRTQAQRDAIVEKFRSGKVWVLICSDLMARGVDFKGVNLVINYDFPQTQTAYVHRIGRTGRMGRVGEAVTLFTERDAPYLKAVANVIVASGGSVPEWMVKMKKISKRDRRNLAKAPPKRARIDTTPGVDRAKRARKRDIIANALKKKRDAGEKEHDDDEGN